MFTILSYHSRGVDFNHNRILHIFQFTSSYPFSTSCPLRQKHYENSLIFQHKTPRGRQYNGLKTSPPLVKLVLIGTKWKHHSNIARKYSRGGSIPFNLLINDYNKPYNVPLLSPTIGFQPAQFIIGEIFYYRYDNSYSFHEINLRSGDYWLKYYATSVSVYRGSACVFMFESLYWAIKYEKISNFCIIDYFSERY